MYHNDGCLFHSTNILISNISCSEMSYNTVYIILFLVNQMVEYFLFEMNLIDLFILSNTKVM